MNQEGPIHTITTDNLDEVLKKEKLVLIDFWAEWCGPCIMMDPVLERFVENQENVFVGRVDADNQPNLVKQYNIKGLPQVLFFKNGKEVKRNTGAMTIAELENFVTKNYYKNL